MYFYWIRTVVCTSVHCIHVHFEKKFEWKQAFFCVYVCVLLSLARRTSEWVNLSRFFSTQFHSASADVDAIAFIIWRNKTFNSYWNVNINRCCADHAWSEAHHSNVIRDPILTSSSVICVPIGSYRFFYSKARDTIMNMQQNNYY